MAQLECPALLVQGGNDIQVDISEAEKLAGAFNDAELVVIDDMNHVLKSVEGDQNANIATYTNPELPVHPQLVAEISAFINNQ